MSGDVQPRKRKDKKRKKDELGLEDPRGVAALGEGDVFMHSQHEHGTGGHWCAKIIFFSLLAVLITLIGLIILENRGLSELEANSVESRYSGVFEGWLEDSPEDDHHDEHTLELTHPDGDDDYGHGDQVDNLDEDEHSEEADDENDDDGDEYEHSEEADDENDDDGDEYEHSDEADDEDDDDVDEDEQDDDDQLEDSHEQDKDEEQDRNQNSLEEDQDNDDNEVGHQTKSADENEDDDDLHEVDENYSINYDNGENNNDDNDEDNNGDNYEDNNGYNDEDNNDDSAELKNDNYEADDQTEKNDDEDQSDNNEDDEEHEDNDGAEDVELEKLEKEASEEEPDAEPISTELPALPEDDDDDNDQATPDDEDSSPGDDDGPEEEEEFLEVDDIDDTPIERITAPAGKPFLEVEEQVSSEQPPDTLADEEEYEKRQEELRKEEEQSSHMWLKLSVGGALLVATHAVLRRATHSRADTPEREGSPSREETPVLDRRMTIIPEEQSTPAKKLIQETYQPKIDKKVIESVASVVKTIPIKEPDSEEEEEERISDEEIVQENIKPDDQELYSDEEEAEENEEVVEEKKEIPKKTPLTESKPKEPEPDEESEDPDDVEIINDEQLEEELEEEEDEEEISDVDDAELLTRLEAKYGKLPEPERPGPKHYKDGGNSIDDEWPGEPSDAYWRRQLDSAERELRQGEWMAAADRAGVSELGGSARARWIVARALDSAAEARRDNRLLSRAITAYLHLLKMNERLPDKKLIQIATRTLDRIQFRGNYLSAEPIYRLLIRRFPNDASYRNNLTISFLMANRADLAEVSLKETLQNWPNDRIALAHYGFVLKTKYNKYEEAVEAFQKALKGDKGPAIEPRFYYHYGDTLLLLGRHSEAHEVHKRGAALGHFLSPSQRSLYNVDRLKSAPWWSVNDTPYSRLANALEKSWKDILKEGEAAKALYEREKEGLKEKGEWSQMDLFVRGQEIPDRCKRAPVTCSVVKSEPAAAGCRRGQVKFSLMAAGTHVRPHVGPTNCRLRMHLGLSNTKDTFIRVDQEIRQWQIGKVLMFDDSFEHEVWHNGTGARLVLIVDVWHPDLAPAERRALPAI